MSSNHADYLAAESGSSCVGGIIPGNDNLQDLLAHIAPSEHDRL